MSKSNAIEILKEMQHFWFEGIELNKRNGDETSFKEFQELNALGEAIVALEKLEKISFILETRIEDVEENIDCLEQELKTLGKEDEIIETELTAYQDHLEDLKEIEKELEGEQK